MGKFQLKFDQLKMKYISLAVAAAALLGHVTAINNK